MKSSILTFVIVGALAISGLPCITLSVTTTMTDGKLLLNAFGKKIYIPFFFLSCKKIPTQLYRKRGWKEFLCGKRLTTGKNMYLFDFRRITF